MKYSIIVPTRNRPDDLRALLSNLSLHQARPVEIVIVDSSDVADIKIVDEFPSFNIRYIPFSQPSAAKQRNAGIECISAEVDLICFLDDDIELAEGALDNMLKFWAEASPEVAGAAFNALDSQEDRAGWFKRSGVMQWLGLYASEPGKVAKSGWQVRNLKVNSNLFVEWLSTSAVFFRSEVLQGDMLDEFFEGYSYLEDLDFSYGISRGSRLVIVAAAGFWHHHHHRTLTPSWYYQFGIMEVRNRLYIVRKYQLSVIRCYVVLLLRSAMTLLEALLKWDRGLLSRFRGNIRGLRREVFGS